MRVRLSSVQTLAVFALLACVLNAWASPLVMLYSAPETEEFNSTPSINAVILMAVLAGLYSIWRSVQVNADRYDYFIVVIVLTLLIVPSSLVAWGIMAITAFLYSYRLGRGSRPGCLVLLATALREPIADVALKLFATQALTFDALLVSWCLSLLGGEGERIGNVVTGFGDHRLLIMTGCASFTNFSIALLAWFAFTRLTIVAWKPRHFIAGAAVGICVICLNTFRLVGMAFGPSQYELIHNGWGPMAFDLIVSITISLIIWLGVKNDLQNGSPMAGFNLSSVR